MSIKAENVFVYCLIRRQKIPSFVGDFFMLSYTHNAGSIAICKRCYHLFILYHVFKILARNKYKPKKFIRYKIETSNLRYNKKTHYLFEKLMKAL